MLVIIVEVENRILGDCEFWRGDSSKIQEIRNTPARLLAEKTVKDGLPRAFGMWRVRAEEVL